MKTPTKYNLSTLKLNALDFERLTESQMEFKGANWEIQEYRFDQPMNFNHKYIYWVENYASLVLATHFVVYEAKCDFSMAYDEAVEMYCFTTDYPSSWGI